MATDNAQNNQSDNYLPYSVTGEYITQFIEAVKKKQGDEKSIKTIFANDRNYSSTKQALECLGIIDDLRFSDIGREWAYETVESSQHNKFLKIILQFIPYELTLLNLTQGGLKETKADDIINFWGKRDIGSTQYIREQAVNAFGYFIQLAGLGTFIIGRKGKPTRIEWSSNAKQRIEQAHKELEIKPDIQLENSNMPTKLVQSTIPPAISAVTEVASVNVKPTVNMLPNITINVDMSNWDESKITAFFKAAYGYFDDDETKND